MKYDWIGLARWRARQLLEPVCFKTQRMTFAVLKDFFRFADQVSCFHPTLVKNLDRIAQRVPSPSSGFHIWIPCWYAQFSEKLHIFSHDRYLYHLICCLWKPPAYPWMIALDYFSSLWNITGITHRNISKIIQQWSKHHPKSSRNYPNIVQKSCKIIQTYPTSVTCVWPPLESCSTHL